MPHPRGWLVLAVALCVLLAIAVTAALSPDDSFVHGLTLTDHVGAFCILALSELLSPMHKLFELAMVSGLIWATVDRVRAEAQARRLLGPPARYPSITESALERAAIAADVPPDRVFTITDSPLPAFTIGALRPRIYLSEKLERILSPEELVAVLAHEGEHLRRRDPLRLSVVRFISRALFWLPAVRSIEEQMAEETELRADAAAARRTGMVTAAALITLMRHFGRTTRPGGSAAFSQHEFIALRVRLLTGVGAPLRRRPSRAAIAVSIVVLALLWTTALAELHNSTHTKHLVSVEDSCVEHARHPVRHMFCRINPDRAEDTPPRTVSRR